jgi:hypothetical protein
MDPNASFDLRGPGRLAGFVACEAEFGVDGLVSAPAFEGGSSEDAFSHSGGFHNGHFLASGESSGTSMVSLIYQEMNK